MNAAPFVQTHTLAAWLMGALVFGLSLGMGLALLARRPPKPQQPVKMRTVWAGLPAVDDGGCCDETDSP